MSLTRRRFLTRVAAGAGAAAGIVLLEPQLTALSARPMRGWAAQAASAGKVPIILDSNENAYGLLPTARTALEHCYTMAYRYPDDVEQAFLARVAKLNGVRDDRVLAGCGSGELLRMAAYAFTGPGRKLVMASPTFEQLRRFSRANGAEVVEVPLRKDYAHDLEAMAARAGADAGLVYVCNPNNPTSSLTSKREIEWLLDKLPRQTYVLVDEAYHHFATGSPDYGSFLTRAADDDRLIVLRTFSKIYGMAGLRQGYAVGTPKALEQMARHQLPNGTNAAALHCATASLDDDAGLAIALKRHHADMKEFMVQAEQRELRTIPPHGNFVMIDTRQPIRRVIAYFRTNNIRIGRPFPPYETQARISLGLPEEMKEFWRVWDKMPRELPSSQT
jgi:histidinol-phosphate aminotransferase